MSAARPLHSSQARVAIVCTVLSLATWDALSAQPRPNDRFAAARDTIRVVMATEGLPSIAVAVAQGDRVLWEEAFGFADRERQAKATPATMYSLASISKPFTATGLMVLVERGRVALEQPANAYLGSARLRAFEGAADSATVRRLLTHTAGLPLHYQFFYEGGPAAPPMDSAIARYGILVYPPGERFFYANFGYGVLDHIIARVSGATFADFMRREVFAPLGLSQTDVSSGRGLAGRAAVRYDNELRPLPPYTFDHLGASAVYSSAHDLVRFGMFHLGAKVPGQRAILAATTIQDMQRSHAPADVPDFSRGLGWSIAEDDNGYRRVSHTGGMPGVATILNLYPSEKLAVVVLTNRSNGQAVARIASAIAATMLPRYAARRAERAAVRQAGVAVPTRVSPTQALLGAWRGRIVLPDSSVPLALEVQPDGDVHVTLARSLPTRLAGARLDDGWISGRFAGAVAAPDAAPASERHTQTLALMLKARDGRLTGWASSLSGTNPMYGAVSFRVELDRADGAPRAPHPDSAPATRLVILGTGTPNDDPERSGPAVAVVRGEQAYLVDAGPGIVRRAAAARRKGMNALEARRLRIVFLTHLHSDHTAGLPDLIFSPWVLERAEPLEVYGPPGTRVMIEHLLAAYGADVRNRIDGLEPANETGWKVNVHEVAPGMVYRDTNVVVRAFAVPHGDWEHAFGYRFETRDRSIVVSGDTRASDSVVKACAGCDVLVHEVFSAERFRLRPPEWQRYHARAHTSTSELADLAKRAGPKLLVLYHQLFWGTTDDGLLAELRKAGYMGPAVSALDLDVFP